jgi:hypothetical protein
MTSSSSRSQAAEDEGLVSYGTDIKDAFCQIGASLAEAQYLVTALTQRRAAWPLAARAQQSGNLPKIGSIHTVQSENSEALRR